MKKFGYHLVALVLALGLVVSACAAPKATPAPAASPAPKPAPAAAAPKPSAWDGVLAAARKEGTVTIYTSMGEAMIKAIAEGMKQYGITVESIGGATSELELRIGTEQKSKAYAADVLMAGWTNSSNMMEAGVAQPITADLPSLGEKGVWKLEPGKLDSTKTSFAFVLYTAPSITVNTNLVKPGEITSWQDLLDSKWKNKMTMSEARKGSGPTASGMAVWMSLGEDFWKKMAAQNIAFSDSYQQPVDDVVLGAKAIVLMAGTQNVVKAIKAGAPVKIINLKEGVAYAVMSTTFIKGAPHPNAVMVLLNWVFSKEGQKAVNTALAGLTVRSDLPVDWMGGIPELDPKNFALMEPPMNLDPKASPRGGEFAKKVFGERQ